VSPAFGLDHIRRALIALGNPQDKIPPAIHITGTNGKGSAGAFIRAMAEAAGLKVHVFTSPHLIRVNERIRIASELVSDDVLAATLAEIAARTQGLTYFEALTAAAFLLFARTPADLSIIEVGAGGATDATNVMARPAACLITPISLDHESMFGVTGIAAIAKLKSGILRTGVPAIIADQPAEALDVVRAIAADTNSPLSLSGKEWRAGWRDGAFVYEGRQALRAPELGLSGAHQSLNAGAACAAIEALADPRITPAAMVAGLAVASWPARLQKLKAGPLTDGFAGTIWVDAAHNPGGAAVLAEAINERADPAVLIFACQAVKDVASVLRELRSAVSHLIACPLPDSGGQEGGAGADPLAIADAARAAGIQASVATSLQAAVAAAKASQTTRIYISGSLYLCGAALAANHERVA